MSAVGTIAVELTVVVGATRLPIRQILKMGRGAIIPLDRKADEPSELHANGVPVARGTVLVRGKQVALRVDNLVGKGG